MPIIPGQSLTAEPMNAPYENPPEMTSPEDAVEWHLDRLTEPDKTEALLEAMELGIDVVTLTEGLLRGAVLGSQHNIDVSLIIAPVIHEFIKTTADKAGIDYEEGFPDDTEERDSVRYSINERKASKMLDEYEDNNNNDGKEEEDLDVEDDDDLEMMEDDVPMQDDMPKGLMSRMSKLEGDI
tara:strand:+ start:2891 stop:3436 length:546 start_codon:yes stop_codon:yes gene_type:complete